MEKIPKIADKIKEIMQDGGTIANHFKVLVYIIRLFLLFLLSSNLNMFFSD